MARIAWNDDYTRHLDDMLTGRSADRILTSGPLPSRVATLRLPNWLWVPSPDSLGRKAKDANGATLDMPCRVTWDCEPVVVLNANSEATFNWSAVGVATSRSGSIRVRSSGYEQPTPPDDIFEASDLTIRTTSKTTARKYLTTLVEKGQRATWNAVGMMDREIQRGVARAAASLSAEIAELDSDRPRLLDSDQIEAVCDTVKFGSDGPLETSIAGRIIERSLLPRTFRKVDPSRYVVTALRRDTRVAVVEAIDDDRLGSKIRRVVREVGPEAALDEYRRTYPADRLGRKRLERALSPGGDCHAAAAHFGDLEALERFAQRSCG